MTLKREKRKTQKSLDNPPCLCYTFYEKYESLWKDNTMRFYIARIEGEYAYLRPENPCSMCEDLMVALALLPDGADVGSSLFYEAGEYQLL